MQTKTNNAMNLIESITIGLGWATTEYIIESPFSHKEQLATMFYLAQMGLLFGEDEDQEMDGEIPTHGQVSIDRVLELKEYHPQYRDVN